jgi:DNA invertase Pin-like site-specific DNA recombinase
MPGPGLTDAFRRGRERVRLPFLRRASAAFDRLTSELIADRFGASYLLLWECSRGSRRVSEWAQLVDACESAGVRVHVTSHGRTYDPARSRDRRSLSEDAVDSEYETGRLSERVKRALAANAEEAGQPHGRMPYGYRREYELRGSQRVLTGQVPDPAAARVVEEIFARIAGGISLRQIAADLNGRVVPTVTGTPWPECLHRAGALAPVRLRLRSAHSSVSATRGPPPALIGTGGAADGDVVNDSLTLVVSLLSSMSGRVQVCGAHLFSYCSKARSAG